MKGIARGNDADGWPGSSQPDFDFRANCDEFDVWMQASDKLVLHNFAVVPAGVKSDAFADYNFRFWKIFHWMTIVPVRCKAWLQPARMIRDANVA